jgi:anti-sigma regulatory factor (Ser/Thr protein kinase)
MRGGRVTGTRRGFDRSFGSLAEVFDFVDDSLRGNEVGERCRMVLHLAVEELFTNMVKYNSGSPRQIAVAVGTRNGHAWLELTDPDADPFDPTAAGPVDVSGPIEERKRGGLGLHLVRSMVDEFEYQYQGREMRLSVTTRLE